LAFLYLLWREHLSDGALYVHPERTWLAGARLLLRAAMELRESIAIHVNGDLRYVTAGIGLSEMLGELGLDPRKVAVERNLEIVPRGTFDHVRVEEGDRLEIVHFVGGG
jgi:thiamine biosynthesis protein ThiS